MKEDNYISLLYKKLSGEISSSEAEELARWRTSKEENEQEARSVELAWELTAPKKDSPQVELDEEFARLQNRLADDTPVRSLAPSAAARNWLRIAAGITVLAIAGFLLKDFFSPAEDNSQWSTAKTQASSRDLLLADGSEIHLNTNSQLSFPQQFSQQERRVRLKGEAFFEVARDENKTFVVEVGGNEIRVLGTSFNIAEHPEEGKTIVYVNSGKVQVSTEGDAENIILTAKQSVSIDNKTKMLIDENQTTANAMGWYSRRLVFDQIQFGEALLLIEEHTQLSFLLKEPALASCLLNTSFEFDNPERFIDDISTIFNAQVQEVANGRYSIEGGTCQ